MWIPPRRARPRGSHAECGFFFFPSFLFSFFSTPSTFFFQGPALISLQNSAAQHGGMNFPIRSNMRYLPLKYWWLASQQQRKKKKKKGCRFNSIVEFRLCPNRWVGFVQRSHLATAISCQEWPVLLTDQAAEGWRRADWGWQLSSGKKAKSNENELPLKVPQVLFDDLQCPRRKLQKKKLENVLVHYSSSNRNALSF